MIKAAGGKDKYESLCQEEKDVLLSAIMQKLTIKLSQDVRRCQRMKSRF